MKGNATIQHKILERTVVTQFAISSEKTGCSFVFIAMISHALTTVTLAGTVGGVAAFAVVFSGC